MLPCDLARWAAVYQQTQRWFEAGCFDAMVHNLRMQLRLASGREPAPTAAVMDSRTLQSTSESGARAGYDGAKRRTDSKVHMTVDTLGHLLTLHVTAADDQDGSQVEQLAQAVQQVTGNNGEVAFVDKEYTGQNAADHAARHGIDLLVVKHTEAEKGFVLLPRRWVVERSFG